MRKQQLKGGYIYILFRKLQLQECWGNEGKLLNTCIKTACATVNKILNWEREWFFLYLFMQVFSKGFFLRYAMDKINTY